MLGEIMLMFSVPGEAKDKWRQLYQLMPNGQATAYFKSVCRKFVKAQLLI